MAEVNTRKRGSKWEYRFEMASVDGRRKQKSKGGFRTKKEALEAGTKALNDYNQGGINNILDTNMSFSDFIDYWFENYAKLNYKYNTLQQYFGHISNHIKPQLGVYRIQSITPVVLQEFINGLFLKGLSKSHTTGIKSTVSKILDYAVFPMQYLRYNPCKATITPKFESSNSIRYIISHKDFKRILERFPEGNVFHVPLMLGFHCGLRISESYALTWDDVDFVNKTISINKIIYKRYKELGDYSKSLGWYIGTTKTSSSNRTLYIDDVLLNTLKKEKIRQNENRIFYGEYYTNQYISLDKDERNRDIKSIVEMKSNVHTDLEKINFISVKENGLLSTTESFKYCARVIKHELKINFNHHSLRHTHATMLNENNINPKAIQSRLGHSRMDMTDKYTHDTDILNKEAAKAFEKVMGEQNK